MALKEFKVFFNRQAYGANVLSGTPTTWYTKAQAEELHRKLGKEPITAEAPVETCEIVQVKAENAEAAVTAVRLKLGAFEAEGELGVCEVAQFEKKSAR